jgi:hypothetical protein
MLLADFRDGFIFQTVTLSVSSILTYRLDQQTSGVMTATPNHDSLLLNYLKLK